MRLLFFLRLAGIRLTFTGKADKGLKLADYGRADVRIGDVGIYPTRGRKLAVGLEIDAKAPRDLIEAKGFTCP